MLLLMKHILEKITKNHILKYIKKFNNLIIIRTFTKSLGLAGINGPTELKFQ